MPLLKLDEHVKLIQKERKTCEEKEELRLENAKLIEKVKMMEATLAKIESEVRIR